jgi:hypothetical protein
MRYSTPGMNRKRNLYWFYLLFFMKRMNLFIEGSEKNGSGSPAGMIWKIQNKKEWYLLATT